MRWSPKPVSQEDVVAAVEELGGEIKSHEGSVMFVDVSGTQVTDEWLVKLSGLNDLKGLVLENTQVTDAGLERLEGLTSLEVINLLGTQITDAGLVHLEVITSLYWAVLKDTQVTDGGVEKLKTALPGCTVIR